MGRRRGSKKPWERVGPGIRNTPPLGPHPPLSPAQDGGPPRCGQLPPSSEDPLELVEGMSPPGVLHKGTCTVWPRHAGAWQVRPSESNTCRAVFRIPHEQPLVHVSGHIRVSLKGAHYLQEGRGVKNPRPRQSKLPDALRIPRLCGWVDGSPETTPPEWA